MADGVAVTPSTATTLKTVDTDEVSRGGQTVHQQVVKISLGPDGVTSLLAQGQAVMSASLPVVLPSDQTVPVSAASLPLPSGASTAAKQPALGTAGAASADVISVQGVASMTAIKVDGSAVTQPVSISGNQAVNVAQINGVTPLMGNGASGTGAQRVTIANDSTGQIALATGTNVVGKVGIDQTTPGTTNAAQPIPGTSGGLSMSKTVSAASTNATSVKASAGQVYSVQAFNVNAAARYLKLYNKASAPTVGTDVPVKTLAIPGNTAGAGFVFDTGGMGLAFGTGIAFAITTGITDADTGAVAASEIVINIDYK